MSRKHTHKFDYRGRLGLCMCGAKRLRPSTAKKRRGKK